MDDFIHYNLYFLLRIVHCLTQGFQIVNLNMCISYGFYLGMSSPYFDGCILRLVIRGKLKDSSSPPHVTWYITTLFFIILDM